MLAGNSSISLVGSEEQIKFAPAISQNAYSCFVVVFTAFSQNVQLDAPKKKN